MALAIGSDDSERNAQSRLGRITLLLFLLAVALLALVVLRAYQARTTEVAFHDVPVLQADAGPTRQRPVEPGGMQVPHQDSAVFENLDGSDASRVVERLLPPPEEPLPKPIAVAAHEIPAAPMPLAPATPAAKSAKSSPVPSEKLVGEAAPVTSGALSSPNEPPRPSEPPVDVAMTAQMPTLANPAESFRVQLGSYRNASKAEAAWRLAVNAAPNLLAPVNHFILQADLGADKGVFHRLQAGPMPSRDSADSLCNQLKAQKVDCYVVAP